MTKIFKYFTLILVGFIWFLGCSKSTSKFLFDNGIIRDDYRYGDLYRLSNLKDFKVLKEVCNDKIQDKTKNVTFYLAGDSFTEEGRISSNDFISKDYFRGFVALQNTPMPASNGKKILIIETVERHLRERFTKPWDNWNFQKPKNSNDNHLHLLELKMPYDNATEEFVLFSSDLVMKIRELKAELNLKLFGETDKKVVLSKDGKRLFYYLDVDKGISSGFESIRDGEIDTLVLNANKTYENYKKMGFDEVYLSIIPNKSSILGQDLGTYNHLVERFEANKNLKMPIITVYNDLYQMGLKSYEVGDTHWTCAGKEVWINKVNQELGKIQ